MRTLKFRAYDSATGKVSEPFDVKESWGDYLIDFDDYSTDGALDSIIWEQFTGLLDRNGKEIYEGDIVRWADDYDENAYICFDEGCFLANWPINSERINGEMAEDIEIIGNIHEPPKDFRPEHLKRMGVSISKGGEE